MNLSMDINARASKAKKIASSAFDEADQLAWACIPRKKKSVPDPEALEDLGWSLVEAVQRQAIPEFVFALLMDGAPVELVDDDGQPLWRSALSSDANKSKENRFAWMIVAKLCLGPEFPTDPRLPMVQKSCESCISELEALQTMQDEYFKETHDSTEISALYAVLDARHDCAMLSLINTAGYIEKQHRQRKL